MNAPEMHSSIKCCMVGIFNYFVDSRVRGYAKWLKKAGGSVDVLTSYRYEANQLLEEDGVRVFTIPSRQQKGKRLMYILDYAASFFVFAARLTKLYFKNHYDVIHFHNMPDFLVFTGLIPKIFGAKIILDIHDPLPEMYMSKFPSKENSIAMKLIRLEERLSAAFSHWVITANTHFKDNLIKRGIPARKITTINNYPDTDIFQFSKRPAEGSVHHDQFTLIFPGTIAPRYGLEVAINAMPTLIREIPNIHLLIIGRLFEHAASLISLAESLGVTHYVEFRPGIPNKKIPELLLQADVGIYPALPDRHMSIAIPGKLLEFAIMGLPIISSRLQIVEEMFDDTAVMFFEPGNAEEFAQCVKALYEDEALRKRMVQRADETLAQKHSLDHEVRKYLSLLNNLANRTIPIPEFDVTPK